MFNASLLLSSVGNPAMPAIVLITSSVIIAGKLPVEAITLAPSVPDTQFTKSNAASLFAEALVTARPVMVAIVLPASAPSGCG